MAEGNYKQRLEELEKDEEPSSDNLRGRILLLNKLTGIFKVGPGLGEDYHIKDLNKVPEYELLEIYLGLKKLRLITI